MTAIDPSGLPVAGVSGDFAALPDLASRALGGGVVYANDELFAERENLIKPEPAVFDTESFGHKGKVYDGWETRRRREPGHDYAIVRLGAAGVVRGVVIDTAFFKGNYPPYASVEATGVEGYPSPAELEQAEWVTLLPKSALKGDAANPFAVDDDRRFTHVRLSIYPDGGVARFRVHGEALPDPRFLAGTTDLVALEVGGTVTACSNMFYSSPVNLIRPDRARHMGEGWENARRRDDGNDYVTFRLGMPGRLHHVELDTSYFVGNAPGWARVSGTNGSAADDPGSWRELLPKTRLQPDTLHRFLVSSAEPVTHVRLDVYPDGGLARVRMLGTVESDVRASCVVRWLNTLPEAHLRSVVTGVGVSQADVAALVGRRPFSDVDALPQPVRTALLP